MRSSLVYMHPIIHIREVLGSSPSSPILHCLSLINPPSTPYEAYSPKSYPTAGIIERSPPGSKKTPCEIRYPAKRIRFTRPSQQEDS